MERTNANNQCKAPTNICCNFLPLSFIFNEKINVQQETRFNVSATVRERIFHQIFVGKRLPRSKHCFFRQVFVGKRLARSPNFIDPYLVEGRSDLRGFGTVGKLRVDILEIFVEIRADEVHASNSGKLPRNFPEIAASPKRSPRSRGTNPAQRS